MKTGKLVSSLILVLAVLIISSCATTPKMLTRKAESGDYAEVKRLIEEGADVNAQDKEGGTALMDASWKGYTDIAQLLIEAGAEVNTKGKEGWTALILASTYGHTEIAILLIEEGADVNARDIIGVTALRYASQEGHTDIVKLLEEAGAK